VITRALVRPPSATYASGLTTAGLGAPDLALALAQHAAYVEALLAGGVTVDALPPDDRFPDATFVEDVAVMTERGAILTRPGAPSRRGEVDAIRAAIEARVPVLGVVEAPGCLDGGDVCEAGSRVLVGLSDRTNAEGASQLASLLALAGTRTVVLDVRRIPGLLHLKTGMAYLGEGRALAWEALEEALGAEPAAEKGTDRSHELDVAKPHRFPRQNDHAAHGEHEFERESRRMVLGAKVWLAAEAIAHVILRCATSSE
jgi:dimethylargininase